MKKKSLTLDKEIVLQSNEEGGVVFLAIVTGLVTNISAHYITNIIDSEGNTCGCTQTCVSCDGTCSYSCAGSCDCFSFGKCPGV